MAEELSEAGILNCLTAKEAGLWYMNDSQPGFTRVKKGGDYIYLDQQGKKIKDKEILLRIRGLIIPHIWTHVWISPRKNGHLQATGIDLKGRKQYRYHKDWDKIRNQNKFTKMAKLGEILPSLRQKIKKNLELRTLTKEKVMATVITILDDSLVRIGNKEYARKYNTFGLTTLRNKHVKPVGAHVQLEFVGKKSIEKKILISDKRLVKIIKKCQELPGYDLFQYYDEEEKLRPVGSEDVNSYLKEITREDITAKDFRTWGGSCIAIKAFMECEPCQDQKTLKKNVVEAIKKVSGCLGNTPSVCKSHYIHPIIIEKYSANEILAFVDNKPSLKGAGNEFFSREEYIFMELLKEITQK